MRPILLTTSSSTTTEISTMEREALLILFADWVEHGSLRALDLAFVRFLATELPDTPPAVLLAAALLSARHGGGHVCLDLQQALASPRTLLASPHDDETDTATAELATLLGQLTPETWWAMLTASAAVSCADREGEEDGSIDAAEDRPLVLTRASGRPLLYLRRCWRDEQQIRAAIDARLQAPALALPLTASRALLASLFNAPAPTIPDWQQVACLLAARSRFAIITGGPGTGKTTTVVRLLALLQGLQLGAGHQPLQIRLAAPTGKAAARLSEAIVRNIDALALDAIAHGEDIRAHIPRQVSTLHRLLGSRGEGGGFRHHAANPLPVDVVVVDEASMMDIAMMARLCAALPAEARLILLGDKDQLASVEAGSVLADLCRGADEGHYTAATASWLKQYGDVELPPAQLDSEGSARLQATAMLRHSYRFSAYPGIGALATLVNSGTADSAGLEALITQHAGSLASIRLPRTDNAHGADFSALRRLAVDGYAAYLRCAVDEAPPQPERAALAAWAGAVFQHHQQFQLLAAVRQGPFGVDALNALIERALQDQGLLPTTQALWYHGRPVMLTRNDYSLQLMNGDVGLCLQWPDGSLRVAFTDEQGDIRWVLPSRLQEVETVYAMTVHKSQGSEFIHTALILPEHASPILGKELIYTGITRSKEKFTLLYSQPTSLDLALQQSVDRVSGL
ncbi:MAG: exodeoxyribonuclease V subunit alpha [Thauera sp.]|jgi:exodeoxyribonuclease V alpha subunit|nr:exodeoxyribonuclease V subunit alpha [Thauera sp.]